VNGLLAQRTLLLLPTLLAVLCFSFFLSKLAPGDEVMTILSMEGKNVNVNRSQYLQLYRSTQQKLAKDRSEFYLTMRPHYQPSHQFDIIPLSYRRALLNLNKEVRDWEKVTSYDKALTETYEAVDQLDKNKNVLLAELNQLEKFSSVMQIKPHWTSIENRLGSIDLSTYPQAQEKIENLKVAIKNLSKTESVWTYPVIAWHGTNNQFHHWMMNLFNVDKRISLRDGTPVFQKIGNALQWTLSLSMISLLLSCGLSLLIALWQVRLQGTIWEQLVSQGLYALYAIPLFWLATMAIVFFTTDEYGEWMNLFPSIGLKYWMADASGWSQFTSKLKLLILPILCMTLTSMTYLTRQLKTDLIRQAQKAFVIPVKAKGINDKRLIRDHLLPNAMIPFITIVTGAIPKTIVGSVVIEVIFNIPGVGRLLLDSIHYSDWPVSFTIILLVGVITIVSYFLADLLYALFFPQLAKNLSTKK
jgi:peptide/nickel transport system permease protein